MTNLETIDGVIDVNAAVEDAGSPGKWKVTGAANYATADGIHPSGGSPVEGDSYYNTTTHKTQTWDGTAWNNHW